MARSKVTIQRGPKRDSNSKRKKVIEGFDEIPSPDDGGRRKTRKHNATTTPLLVDPRFKTDNYNKLYIKNFGTRKIAHGRVVDFKSLEKNNAGFVREWFQGQSWDKLLVEREPVYPDLVRQFYTHFDHSNKEEGEIHTWVKGVDIVLDEHTLGKILNIPTTGLHELPGRKWSKVEGFDKEHCIKLVLMDQDAESLKEKPRVDQLPMPTRLLHLIIMHTFISRVGRKSSLTFLDLLVMHCILAKVKVNMPRMMINYMVASQKSTNGGSLPYGMWLTKVFRYFNVDLSNEAFAKTKFRAFSHKTISGSIGYSFDKKTGLWTKLRIKRAPRRKDPSGKEEVKRPRVDEDGGKDCKEEIQSLIGHDALLQMLVVQEMLRLLQPNLFTPDQLVDIHEAAKTEMAKHINRLDAENNSGNIIGDNEDYDNGDVDDDGDSGAPVNTEDEDDEDRDEDEDDEDDGEDRDEYEDEDEDEDE